MRERPKCVFGWVERTPERVILRDLDGYRSITNDAETLVAALLELGEIVAGRTRLFYYDTDDDFDEIVFDASGFVRFAPARELDPRRNDGKCGSCRERAHVGDCGPAAIARTRSSPEWPGGA